MVGLCGLTFTTKDTKGFHKGGTKDCGDEETKGQRDKKIHHPFISEPHGAGDVWEGGVRIFAKKVTVSNYEDPHGNANPQPALIASGVNGEWRVGFSVL